MCRIITNNNIIYNVGENARDNWDIVENAEPDDIWLHLHDFPSCHVIIETPKNDLCENDIIFGANLCKQYSKYKDKKVKISVLDKKHVIKGKAVGEVKLLKTPRIITI